MRPESHAEIDAIPDVALELYSTRPPVTPHPAYHRKVVLAWALAALAPAALGCATTRLSANGSHVVVLDEAPAARCSPMGTITGSADPFFGALRSEGELVAAARNDAANQAANIGATHVRFAGAPGKWPSGVFGGGTAYTVTADAYRCDDAMVTPAGPGQGCTKDTDCKGERICEAGKCVDQGPR